MKLLLDTHAFLWFIDDNPQLSREGGRRFLNVAIVSTDAAFDVYPTQRVW